MAVYGTDFAVEVKADASAVTEADTRAEAVILKGLSQLSPGIAVIAEEQAAAGNLPQTGPLFYLVDPLDGTREFVSRNGEFTVNIALIANGVPVAGVLYAPALGRLYFGATGSGAFRRDTAAPGAPAQPIQVRPAPQDGLAAVGSRSHGNAETADWLGRKPVASLLSAGSSLKFGLLAEGAADLYPRFSRTMEWDTAAGDAILRAAGGIVLGPDGTPLRYGKADQPHDAPYANPSFIAYGDPTLAARLAASPAG